MLNLQPAVFITGANLQPRLDQLRVKPGEMGKDVMEGHLDFGQHGGNDRTVTAL